MEATRTLIAGDAEIAYRLWRPAGRRGPRGAIVAIHGLASNMTRWSEFVANTCLTEGWEILRLDLRGHGGSCCRGRVGFEQWCADLAALLEVERIPRIVIVGHCLGANVGLWFAHRYPAMVAGLVLIEPMFRQALVGQLARAARLRPLLQAAAPVLRAIAALGIHRRHLDALDLEQLDRETRAAMSRSGSGFPESRYASIREDLRSVPISVYVQDLLAVTGTLPDIATVEAPTLALLSQGTSFTDPETTIRLLSVMPHCRVERLDAQHWIPTERPEAMRMAIEDWCREKFGG